MAALIGGNVVELDYHELKAGVDLTDKIRAAFGVDGIGVLTVSNVPNYSEARKKLLPLSRQFAILPDEIKEKYVHKDSYYSFGWSHGKEKLQGKPDISKGSYYANPQYDEPETDPAVIAKYASFVHPNIWPKEELPELEFAFKELGQIIVSVGALVAQQCDRYVHQSTPSYLPNSLEKVILESKCCKARLLHYFPISEELPSSEHKSEDTEYSSWCGWHNDHGSLTGLTSAMYLDSDGNEVVNSDETAGLYVRNRQSQLIKVNIPQNHIGFQIGETAQVHSGGCLQATPHAVRGSKIPAICRETFAVFMEPMWDEPMKCPDGVDPSMAQSQSAAANLPKGVPPLGSRWKPSKMDGILQNFGEFSEATHKSYY